jgi:hypothetical protein
MALERRGELVLLTLGSGDRLHRASNGDALCSDQADGGKLLQHLSGVTKTTNDLLTTSPSFSRQRICSGGGKFLFLKGS